jgi:hypothetical protein
MDQKNNKTNLKLIKEMNKNSIMAGLSFLAIFVIPYVFYLIMQIFKITPCSLCNSSSSPEYILSTILFYWVLFASPLLLLLGITFFIRRIDKSYLIRKNSSKS